MKKILSLAAMLTHLLTAWAVAFTVDGINYINTLADDLNVEVSLGNYSEEVVIPASVQYKGNTYSVTSIGDYAFEGCSGLTSIEIPNSVTSIGDWAFSGCSGLTSIEIPNSVTSIGTWAFCDCSGLTSIEISNSVTSIGTRAFRNCSGLTSVTCLAESVPTINSNAFDKSPISSATLYVPVGSKAAYEAADVWKDFKKIIEINDYGSCGDKLSYVFEEATGTLTISGTGAMSDYKSPPLVPWYLYRNSIKKIVLNNGVTTIGDYAFSGCSGLTSIEISNSVTSIGNSTFSGCSGLTSIEISNSVTSIGNSAFYGCSGLTSIEIPNSVTSIGNSAFSGCSGLTSIEIPNSVTSIGDYAFSGCYSLTSIEIPNSVTSIGTRAFSGSSGLTSINVESGNSKYDSRDNCNAKWPDFNRDS